MGTVCDLEGRVVGHPHLYVVVDTYLIEPVVSSTALGLFVDHVEVGVTGYAAFQVAHRAHARTPQLVTGDAGATGKQFSAGGPVEALDKMENGVARLGRQIRGPGCRWRRGSRNLPRLKLCVKTKLPMASLSGKSVAKRGNGARIISVGHIGFS